MTRRDRLRNEVRQGKLQQKETTIEKTRWFGHVTRMNDRRLPSRVMHCHVEGTRSKERLKKRRINIQVDVQAYKLDMRTAIVIIDKRQRTMEESHELCRPHHRQADGREEEEEEEEESENKETFTRDLGSFNLPLNKTNCNVLKHLLQNCKNK